MRVIGLRATPKLIFYSIVSIEVDGFTLDNSKVIVPKSFALPDKLRYIRQTFIDLIDSNKIKKGAIRTVEPNAQSLNKDRLMIEGVLTELLASSIIQEYYAGATSTICKRNKIANNGALKAFFDGSEIFKGIIDWKDFSKEHRESIITAFGTIEI